MSRALLLLWPRFFHRVRIRRLPELFQSSAPELSDKERTRSELGAIYLVEIWERREGQLVTEAETSILAMT